jgi:hypothetical protein
LIGRKRGRKVQSFDDYEQAMDWLSETECDAQDDEGHHEGETVPIMQEKQSQGAPGGAEDGKVEINR